MAVRRTIADGSTRRLTAKIALAALATALLLAIVCAGGPPAAADDAPPPQADDPSSLATEERQVLDRFSELEKKLLRMAELTAGTDPHRAALLRKAVAQSKQQGIESQLAKLVEMLGQDRLAPAVKSQAAVEQDLTKLLELLLSEDRSKRLQSEKERIGKYIQRVNQLIKQQKQLQGEAAGQSDLEKIAEQQGQLAEKTQELARDLGESQSDSKGKKKPGSKARPAGDDAEGKPGKDKPGEGDSPDTQPSEDPAAEGAAPGDEKDKPGKPEGKPGDDSPEGNKNPDDKKPADGKPGDDPGAPGESGSPDKPADAGQPSDGKPGTPPEGSGEGAQPAEAGEAAPSDEGENSPVRERVAQAEQKMRDAQKKLAEAMRDDAVQRQEEAKRALELAKAELEAILRQLREEEIGRTLAMLEARFRKMLDLQNQVNTGTRRVDKVPALERDHDDEIEAGRLSRQEAAIVAEADKALAVLHDEGSAVAFPEAVSDLRDDMEQVVVRLAQAKVDALTQGLEDDIVVALEEMISALHAAQKEQAQQVKPKGAQSGGDTEAPLVDDLSEIRMIRSMQMWVNQRTKRYTELAQAEQSESPDLIAGLRKLADREERIRRVTRDIVVGRNK